MRKIRLRHQICRLISIVASLPITTEHWLFYVSGHILYLYYILQMNQTVTTLQSLCVCNKTQTNL